jgi:F0F1-type ATP synthase membrane subunit b/b'
MAKKAKADDPEDVQPPLIPMSDEELKKAGREMANLVHLLEDMEEEHAETNKEYREERDRVRKELSALASTFRQQGR